VCVYIGYEPQISLELQLITSNNRSYLSLLKRVK